MAMLPQRLTTNELLDTLESLLDSQRLDGDLIRELQVHQLELEIQNRELRLAQEQLAQARRRYADLYDFSPVGYASLDEKGTIEEINLTGGKLLGDNPHKLIGHGLSEFIVAADVPKFLEHLRHCRHSRRKRRIEIRLITDQPEQVYVDLFTMATHDVERHSLQFRTAMLDVTLRKRAEDAVRQSQSELERKITERTEELTESHHQREEAQRFLNEASAVLSASLDYEITLWSLARAAVPHLADCCVVDVVKDNGEIQRVSVAHVHPDQEQLLRDPSFTLGTAETIQSGRPRLEDQLLCVPLIIRGQTIGAIGLKLERADRRYNLFDQALAEDLADRAGIALDNATLYSKELEANRLKDEFLAMVSHELRTPLTPILGAIYKLRSSSPQNEELQRNLEIIERNAKGQARIVEDLLDISRITTGKLDFQRQPTDIQRLIQSAIDVVRPAAEALDIGLEATLEKPRDSVWCDRDRIQQVIWNLLSNAIKFTSHGGTIKIRLENREKGVRITISDTGVGITREFLPHVFEEFRQSDNFTTRMHGGLGLGLSIVRYVVERHGGTVRAESEGQGHGATFIVDLPFSY
jgi:PAS domain S-box-containing protein